MSGMLRDSPSPLMMHSPQMPQFHSVGQQSPPPIKKHVSLIFKNKTKTPDVSLSVGQSLTGFSAGSEAQPRGSEGGETPPFSSSAPVALQSHHTSRYTQTRQQTQ